MSLEPSGNKPAIIWGLVQIAAALGVAPRTLERWLDRPAGERPPIRKCHRGFYAYEARLQAWVDCEDMDAGAFRELERARRGARPGLAKCEDGDSCGAAYTRGVPKDA